MSKKKQIQVEEIDLENIKLDPDNPRAHPEENLVLLEHSAKHLGAGRSILIDENDQLLAGEGFTTGAKRAGMKKAIVIDVEGDQVVAVRRKNLTEEQKREMKVIDNQSTILSEWRTDQLLEILQGIPADELPQLGFDSDQLNYLLSLGEQKPPSLKDLEDQHGSADDSGVFGRAFEVRLSLPVHKEFSDMWAALAGASDDDKARWLIEAASKTPKKK
jgi:hypothetical protein